MHVDTSPHLVRVNERIRLAGQLIGDKHLSDLINRVLIANDGEPLSFYEGMTAAAFLAFAEHPADLAIVEVGLGGRFDSTNVFKAPAVSVVTPIDYDHKEFLGKHLCQIAWEKAGIIKTGCPVVSAHQAPDVERTLRAEATFQEASSFSVVRPGDYSGQNGELSVSLDGLTLANARLGLKGSHQYANAALAVHALQKANVFTLDQQKAMTGLASAVWPARLQRLEHGPLTKDLGEKAVWLDGGHNPHAGRAIAESLTGDAPVTIIMAMLANKDATAFLAALKPVAERLIAIPMPKGHAGRAPESLAKIANEIGIKAETAEDVSSAVQHASGFKTSVLICGSLYLAGDVLQLNNQEPV